jgi:valyl-tRNA synthetase
MGLPRQYAPATREPEIAAFWQEAGIYDFTPDQPGPVYSIDTPPPTVSGLLHLGHVYSYSHTDFIARFRRMRGAAVFYPMGFDDNGLPTERLVERQLGARVSEIGREAFIATCLEVSEEAEDAYRALWQRLGLSVDWRYTYRTIDVESRRMAQWSFLDLYRKELAYRQTAPAIWCPECQTAIAQAELDDLERTSEFSTLAFALENGETLPIATTRPELLPACVAIFVHPDDARFAGLVGQQARVPLFGQRVPVLADPQAEPEKGTGAVMCCTFGDVTDVVWWRTHALPLRSVIGRDGRLTALAGEYAGLSITMGRERIIAALAQAGLVLDRRPVAQSVRVHERCDTPVEYIMTPQWFVRVLDRKPELLAAGKAIAWHPASMGARYREWVENLHWDWCISRQRAFGVPFPVWHCDACGTIMLAREDELPVDPIERAPAQPCACGSTSLTPETDVMDTWATSSLSPQIVGQYLRNPALYARVFPFALRPQAHEIIRTWAFTTIVKSLYHFATLPFREVAISGWGIAAPGAGKISKSRGGGPMAPLAMIERYSADAVRYWAASTGFGKDSVISEEKIQTGQKLVTKFWNAARFAERFLDEEIPGLPAGLPPADAWILSRLQRLVARATELLEAYDYAAAKSEVESFFWQALTDNYLELVKLRLYGEAGPAREAARATLHTVLLTLVKLFAPFLPYVTEEIYRGLFAAGEGAPSVHRARWPEVDPARLSDEAEALGETLVAIATTVRRYKSESSLALGAELARLHLVATDAALAGGLRAAENDLRSITRARAITVASASEPALHTLRTEEPVGVQVAP